MMGQIPENIHGMISEAHQHCYFLLNVPKKDLEKLPAPPTPKSRKVAVEVAGHLGYLTAETFNDPSKKFNPKISTVIFKMRLIILVFKDSHGARKAHGNTHSMGS
ncbi:hypothetical protein O181_014760 [Austropuccinia psidii MF-1]|uniref:Uncharacterized protein n=1 Tax=Austropuccinia psidii MF-1 TaxID=1389203 RepID=A0A9Q3GQ88_9BASI|nr:hypothetical protein [Austropuccinia psidii MF-1]